MGSAVTSGVRRRAGSSPAAAGTAMVALVGLLWLLELVDRGTGGSLDRFGIEPRDPDSLDSILYAPFLHAGLTHLAANTVPLLVLGFLVLLSGASTWAVVTVVAMLGSGLAAWLLSPPLSVTVGASGVVFGWLAFLLVRGLFSGSLRQLLLAVLVFVLFGGVLWGVLPGTAGISWQGHLGGAVGGVVAAWWLRRRRAAPTAARSPSAYR